MRLRRNLTECRSGGVSQVCNNDFKLGKDHACQLGSTSIKGDQSGLVMLHATGVLAG
jgi:hypothetical protein